MAFRSLITLSLLLFSLSGCERGEERLRIVVANSVRPAAEELIRECPALKGERTELVFTSSGKAVAQIRKGAPYDLFMSADREYPEALQQSGHGRGKVERFAFGVPVLFSSSGSFGPWEDASVALKKLAFERIAVADPKTAPFGRLTERILKKEGMNEALEKKKVFGSGIAEVDRYLRTGNVELGITSFSTALDGSRGNGQPQRRRERGEGAENDPQHSSLRASSANSASPRLASMPPNTLPFTNAEPLPQSMLRIDRDRSPEIQKQLDRFFRFVLSPQGQRILQENGHLPAKRQYAGKSPRPDA